MLKGYKKLLAEFVAIPSVSADLTYMNDVIRASKSIAAYLSKVGLQTEIIKGYENPIVVARTPKITNAETVLVYGHYDVQPAGAELFKIVEKGGKIYGRGVADNKGQILIHICSIVSLLERAKLKYNIIFLIEGNEETGSFRLPRFLKDYNESLKSDCILVSDSELGSFNKPALEVSFRGAANFEVMLDTGSIDLHSGLFGGVASNAAEELGKIAGSLTEFTGGKANYKPGTKRYEERRTLEETVEVTGFQSGYNDTGFRNCIPCQAVAKINVRSTPAGDPKKLRKQVQNFILKKAPKYAKIRFVDGESAKGLEVNLENQFARRANEILTRVYSQKPVAKRGGGTLPIGDSFKKILKAPLVMVPLADEGCGAHSAAEFLSVNAIIKGLEFSSRFFSNV